MPRRQANDAAMEARTTAVYAMLLAGASRGEILQFTADKWEIATRQTDNLIRRARKQLAQDAEPERAYMRGLAVNRLNTIYQKAMRVQDFRVALASQKQLSDLLALETPKTLKVIGELLNPQEAAKLAELLELLEQRGTSAGDMFSAMMAEIAQVEQEAAADE